MAMSGYDDEGGGGDRRRLLKTFVVSGLPEQSRGSLSLDSKLLHFLLLFWYFVLYRNMTAAIGRRAAIRYGARCNRFYCEKACSFLY